MMVHFVKFLLIQHFLWHFVPQYLVNCCSDSYKTYYFWKMMRSFRLISISCFNRFRFLAEVSTNLQKCTILGSLRTITQEGKKETRQMIPFFSSTFWALTDCDIHFCIWKMSKFVFMGSPFDQNLFPFNSGNIHIKETKEPGFTFSNELKTKFVWSHGLNLLSSTNMI